MTEKEEHNLRIKFEEIRQGFADARNFLARSFAEKSTMDAYHYMADNLVVEYGGESVRYENVIDKDK